MQFSKLTLTVALIVAGAMPAFAQDQTPPAAAAPAPDTQPAGTAAAEAPAAPATDPAVPADPQPGQTYVAEEHGDWEVRCVKAESGPEPCQLYQVLKDDKGGAVAEIVIFPLPESDKAIAGAVVTTPLETLLTEGVTIAIDGTEGKRYPFSFCTPQGCVSRIGLLQADLDAMKRGKEAMVRIVPVRAADQQVVLTASLSGFTAGYDAVVKHAAKPE